MKIHPFLVIAPRLCYTFRAPLSLCPQTGQHKRKRILAQNGVFMYDDDIYGRNPMSTAAFSLGFISILTCSMFYIALPCGALAVICAILSHGSMPMPKKSKTGLIFGICGMVVSAAVTVMAVRMVLTNPQLRSNLEYMIQMYTGDYSFDLDEELDRLLPSGNDSPNTINPEGEGIFL